MSQWHRERHGPKVCTGCGAEKPIEEYGRRNRTADGRKARCKDCEREAQRRWAAANPAKARARARRSYRNNADTIKARSAAYKRANREKARAHSAVEYAVNVGNLEKPDECEECGTAAEQLHGHHEDYSKPLAVRWLCPRCHKEAHRVAMA